MDYSLKLEKVILSVELKDLYQMYPSLEVKSDYSVVLLPQEITPKIISLHLHNNGPVDIDVLSPNPDGVGDRWVDTWHPWHHQAIEFLYHCLVQPHTIKVKISKNTHPLAEQNEFNLEFEFEYSLCEFSNKKIDRIRKQYKDGQLDRIKKVLGLELVDGVNTKLMTAIRNNKYAQAKHNK